MSKTPKPEMRLVQPRSMGGSGSILGPSITDGMARQALELTSARPTLEPTAPVEGIKGADGLDLEKIRNRMRTVRLLQSNDDAVFLLVRGDLPNLLDEVERLRALSTPEMREEAGEGAAEGEGVGRIAAERRRQVEREGYSTEHDDTHDAGELAACAAGYAMPPDKREMRQMLLEPGKVFVPKGWPFECCDWKPGDRIRELEKAGALVAAEIDRLLRKRAAEDYERVLFDLRRAPTTPTKTQEEPGESLLDESLYAPDGYPRDRDSLAAWYKMENAYKHELLRQVWHLLDTHALYDEGGVYVFPNGDSYESHDSPRHLSAPTTPSERVEPRGFHWQNGWFFGAAKNGDVTVTPGAGSRPVTIEADSWASIVRYVADSVALQNQTKPPSAHEAFLALLGRHERERALFAAALDTLMEHHAATPWTKSESDRLFALRTIPTPSVAQTEAHRCGVRGFADSGDECPGCSSEVGERRFPVHSSKGETIPWSEAERVYEAYAKRFPGSAASQSIERIAQRGGFSRWEIADLLGLPHGPTHESERGT